MIRIHPEFLTRAGKRVFAVLPYEEYVAIHRFLEEASDLIGLPDYRWAEAPATESQFEGVTPLPISDDPG